MGMYTIERTGFASTKDVTLALIGDLITQGAFTPVYPLTGGNYVAPTADVFTVILESTSKINPYNASQPYRIAFMTHATQNADKNTSGRPVAAGSAMSIIVGTSANLKNDGTIRKMAYKLDSKIPVEGTPYGALSWGWTWENSGAPALPAIEGENEYYQRADIFLSTADLGVNLTDGSFDPMNYRLVLTNRGIFWSYYRKTSIENGRHSNWFVIQHSVDKDTGAILGSTAATTNSKRPIFCVFHTSHVAFSPTLPEESIDALGITSGSWSPYYAKLIVNERDIPSLQQGLLKPPVNGAMASQNSLDTLVHKPYLGHFDITDSAAVLNPFKQVSFNENGDYVLSFLNNLNTPRFKYTTELDMVGTISADVVGAGQEFEIQCYGEAQKRVYLGLMANLPYSTGMRVCVLINNPNDATPW